MQITTVTDDLTKKTNALLTLVPTCKYVQRAKESGDKHIPRITDHKVGNNVEIYVHDRENMCTHSGCSRSTLSAG